MSIHLLPALFSCISPHTKFQTWETENTMEFVVMKHLYLTKKGTYQRGLLPNIMIPVKLWEDKPDKNRGVVLLQGPLPWMAEGCHRAAGRVGERGSRAEVVVTDRFFCFLFGGGDV